MADVIVVGAGPAGVAAAATLARAGRHVVLLDKAEFPRDKCCGDGLTTLALRELEVLGFDPSVVDDWQVVDGAVLRSPSGREVTVELPAGRGTFRRGLPAAPARRGSGLARHEERRRRARRARLRRPPRPAVRSRDDRCVGPSPDHRPIRDRRRRHVEPRAEGGRSCLAGVSRRVARLPGLRPRRHGTGRRSPLRVVRERLPAGIRLVVPIARRPGQRRFRGDARRRTADPGDEAAVDRACPIGRTSGPRWGPPQRWRTAIWHGRSRRESIR